jgi:hypothetical protein
MKLHNSFLQIAPVEHRTLLPGQPTTYNEIGIVLAKDESTTGWLWWKKPIIPIKVGEKVRFDRFLAYKFPREGSDESDWFVKMSEVITSEKC